MTAIKTFDIVTKDGVRFSPHAWRTTMAVAHKGLENDCLRIGFTDIPGICDGNRKIVPTIEHGENILSDSWAIAEYLENEFPDAPSLFGGALGKGHARFINDWAAFSLHPVILKIILMDIYDSIQEKDRDYFRTSREARFGRSLEDLATLSDRAKTQAKGVLTPLSKSLEAQPWLGGDAPSYADFIVFGAFQWCRTISTFDLPAEGGDSVVKWMNASLDLFDGLGRAEPAAS